MLSADLSASGEAYGCWCFSTFGWCLKWGVQIKWLDFLKRGTSTPPDGFCPLSPKVESRSRSCNRTQSASRRGKPRAKWKEGFMVFGLKKLRLYELAQGSGR